MSLRTAVDGFCHGCIYDKREDADWVQQVEACTSRLCPLYPVRPTTARPDLAEGRLRDRSGKAIEDVADRAAIAQAKARRTPSQPQQG